MVDKELMKDLEGMAIPSFGELSCYLRSRKVLTSTALPGFLRLSRSWQSKIECAEAGHHPFSPGVIARYIRKFGLTIEYAVQIDARSFPTSNACALEERADQIARAYLQIQLRNWREPT